MYCHISLLDFVLAWTELLGLKLWGHVLDASLNVTENVHPRPLKYQLGRGTVLQLQPTKLDIIQVRVVFTILLISPKNFTLSYPIAQCEKVGHSRRFWVYVLFKLAFYNHISSNAVTFCVYRKTRKPTVKIYF